MNFKYSASYILLLVFVLCATSIWYGYSLINRVTSIEELWVNYNRDATQSSFYLSEINSNFGYGGFIHNFKNYILHQNQSLIPIIDQNLEKTYDAIRDYNNLSITKQEKKALSVLSHIVDIYSSKFEFTKKLVANGSTPREIEINVQVNDSPAFEAIDFLAQYSVDRSSKMEEETHAALKNTIYFLKLGSISILLIILVGIVVMIFLKKLLKANQEIENTKQYSDDLIESAPDAWFIINKSGKIIRINSQAEQLFGYKKEFLNNKPIEYLIPKHMQNGHNKLRDSYFENPRFRAVESIGRELLAIDSKGREFPVEISLAYTQNNGEMLAVAATRDISKRKYVEERQKLTEKVFENAGEGILILDHKLRVFDCNQAFCRLSGYQYKELLRHSPRFISNKSTGKEQLQKIQHSFLENGEWHGELWLKCKSLHQLPVLTSISEVKGKHNTSHYVIIFSDISQQKEQEDRLNHLAHYDTLTALPNRTLFFERFKVALKRAKRQKQELGIFYIDLDGFKEVNDTLGHQAGDKILTDAAKTLLKCTRDDDTVARIGGDEFVILFNNIEDEAAIHILAKRIVKKISFSIPTNTVPRKTLYVTASIGIALYPTDGDDEETLLRQADTTMYNAKKQGKNTYSICTDVVKKIP